MSIKKTLFLKHILSITLFVILFTGQRAYGQFTASLSSTATVCSGTDLNLNISGGTAPYTITYYLNGVQTIVTTPGPGVYANPFKINVTNPNNYQISFNVSTVTDAAVNYATLSSSSLQVNVSPYMDVTAGKALSTCFFNNAAVMSNVKGTPPFKITATDGSNNTWTYQGITASSPPIYLPAGVTFNMQSIVDANNCSAPLTSSFSVGAGLSFNVVASTPATSPCGTVLTLTNPATGITYQWFVDGIAIPQATGLVYNATLSGKYYVVGLQPLTGCVLTSNYVNVTLTKSPPPAQPSILPNPAGPYSCGQTDPVLSFNGSGVYDIYTWRKNGTVVQQGSSSSLTINSSGTYDLSVQNNNGCPSPISGIYNAIFQNSGFTSPTITSTATTINCGETARLSVSNGTYSTYQWLKNGTDIPGATASTYDVTQVGGSYSVLATQGPCNSGLSNSLGITVNPVLVPVLNRSGLITIALNSGLNVLTDVSNNVYDSYQWQSSANNSTYTDIPGATLVSYSFPAGNTFYRLKVTKNTCSVFSAYVFPQVTGPATNLVVQSNNPSIMCSTGQLIADPGYSGYQWYKNNVLLPGETASAINVGNPANGSGAYAVKYTDSYGLTYMTPSFKLLVLADIKPVVAITNPGCSGESGLLTISQPATNLGVYKHYTWTNSSGVTLYDYELSKAPSTTAAIFVGPGDYTLTVTDYAGCTSTQTVTVNAAAASPAFTPTIATSGGITKFCKTSGSSTTGLPLQVTNISSLPPPTGTNVYFYQWMVDGAPAPFPTYTGTGVPPASFFLGSSQYSALNSGTYSLQIREEYNGYPLSAPPAGWVASRCFGISNAVTITVDYLPNPAFSVSTNSLCPNMDLTVNFINQISANTTLNWNFGTPGDFTIISGTGSGPYVIRYATTGSKNITLSLNNSSCGTLSSFQTIDVHSPIPIGIQSPTPNIYPGCSAILQVDPNFQGSIGTWSGGPFASAPAGRLAFGLPTVTTTYSVTGIDNNTCPTSGSININVLPLPNTSFSYPATICNDLTQIYPTFPAGSVNGHNFSVDKSGLSGFITSGGNFNPSASTTGILYTVTNAFPLAPSNGYQCPVFKSTSQFTIVKKPANNPFSYSSTNTFCSNQGVISPVFSLVNGPQESGAYTFYPASGSNSPANGLTLNAANGNISLSTCKTGAYMVRFTPLGDASCAQVYQESRVTITEYQDPAFSYPQTVYCNNVSGSQAIPNNQAINGQYSLNPWNLNMNQSGVIDLYNAAPGSYTVTKTISGGGCTTISASASFTIYAPKVAAAFYYVNSSNTFVNNFCEGSSGNLSPVFTPSTGIGTLSISPVPAQGWTSTSINMALLPPGTYTITNTVTDPQCSASSFTTTTLTVKPKPSVVLANQSICSGGSFNQALVSTPSGSSFSWTSTVTSGSVTGNGGGGGTPINQTLWLANGATSSSTVKYTVTPNLNLCPGNPVDMIITVNPVPTLTPFANKTICSGTTITVPLTSSIAGAAISWSASQSSGTVTGFSSGTGTSINQTLTGSGIVNYSITTILNGCSSVYAFQVTVNPIPVLTGTLPSALSVCNGNPISQPLSASPAGTNINWITTVTSGSLTGVYSASGTTISQTPWLASGATTASVVKYTVTPSLNGCSGIPADMIVNVNPVPVINTVSDKTTCSGNVSTIAFSSNNAAASISWIASLTSGAVTGFSSGSGNSIMHQLTGSGVLNYALTASLNGCSTTTSFTITVKGAPALTVALPTLNICNGGNFSQALTATPSGSTFAWTNTVTAGSVTGNGNGSGTVINQTLWLASGATSASTVKYTVTPSLNGCPGSSADLIVNVNPIPALSTVSNKTICSGAALSVPLSTNLTGANISWTPSLASGTVTGFSSGSGSAINQTLTGGPGVVNYALTGSLNGCTSVSSFTVTVNPKPDVTVSLSSSDVCAGTQINYSYTKPSGSSTLVNFPVSSFSIASSSITATVGTYVLNTLTAPGSDIILTVTNPSTLCSTNTVSHVTIRSVPLVTANSLAICAGNGFSLPVTSNVTGSTFSWTSTVTGTVSGFPASGSLAAPASITANAVTGSGTITYSITASANGCTSALKTAVVTVNTNLPSSLTATPMLVCEGSNVTINGSYPVGYTTNYVPAPNFTFLGGGGGSGGGFVGFGQTYRAGAGPGTFRLTVTSPSGCISDNTVTVNVNQAPNVSASNVSICEGAGFTIPISSTTSGVTYTWTSTGKTGTIAGYPVSGTSSQIIGDAAATTGNGTITYRVNSIVTSTGCISPNLTVTVTVNANLPSFFTVTPTTVCAGSIVTASVDYPVGYTATYTRAPGFTILGGGAHNNPGYTGFSEGLRAGASSGDFKLEVTSPFGCKNSYPVTITVNPGPDVVASDISICEGAGFDIPLSSTTPGVAYSWTVISMAGTAAGYPSSGTGNHISASSITGNGSIVYKVNSSSGTSCNSADYFVTVTVNPNAPHIAGFYDVNSNPIANGATICQGGKIIFAANTPAGYTFNYTPPAAADFQQFFGGGSSVSFAKWYNVLGSNDGVFTYESVSDLGCTRTSQYTIHVNPAPTAPVINFSPAMPCSGAPGGWGHTIEADLEYSSSFDDGMVASGGHCAQNETSFGCSLTWGNTQGMITVTATNSVGCSSTSQVYVPIQVSPVINEVSPAPICSGGTTAITLNSVPNSSTINYTWESFVSDGTINGKSNFENLSNGSVNTSSVFGYTIQEVLSGLGTAFYHVTATSPTSGCSSETFIYQEVAQASTPSVTVNYFPHVPSPSIAVFTAYPVNCGSNPQYQWKVNGVNVAGATGPTYQNPNLSISLTQHGVFGDIVSCTVTSSDACSNGTQVTSPGVYLDCGSCRTAALTTATDQRVSASPNPFSETIRVNIPDSFGDEVELVIKDMKGIEVERLKTTTGEAEFGQNLASGVYILQVVRKSGTETIKIVKAQ
jgi:hypothetical protein